MARTLSRLSVELTACPTSPSARNSSNGPRKLRCPRLKLRETTARSVAITAWSAKILSMRDLLALNGSTRYDGFQSRPMRRRREATAHSASSDTHPLRQVAAGGDSRTPQLEFSTWTTLPPRLPDHPQCPVAGSARPAPPRLGPWWARHEFFRRRRGPQRAKASTPSRRCGRSCQHGL